ncbi:autoinducer 2 ABC transporter ATP-binding protein LsrA [Rubellimicrobium sp. CFH 75288]|uniref:autoinducer 2 ABC transporter ATP-binding protein LsrA n=1 Tax=Rubellimicrobium sp. CFH 75288 TaxID=2697034 RepID=UPI001412DBD6|nr:autoinducer 2 ABC transporter ATP-binding protein LsrA [Rubellimicrobium sp. CFH 75288]NAZ36468.1 autoinducer 2 ABC transporter ATP-binding protein LsrA [Rubellimicrobium sp. CFH 75288]
MILAELQGITKSYAGVPVLRGVDFAVRTGEIHALLGGNGAGKSTLMKILSGLVAPTAGQVLIGGRRLLSSQPQAAHASGLYLVPQETHLFAHRTVLENVAMGMPLPPRAYAARVAELARGLGVDLPLGARGATLEVADRQIVEILRGLLREARVLVFDEPTSALTPHEAGALFDRMRALREAGVGQVFISHKLHELRAVSDRITVLRDGMVVLSGPMARFSDESILAAMSPGLAAGAATRSVPPGGTGEALRLDGVSGEGFSDVSLALAPGEVLGLAGVVGAGRTELAETLVGLRPLAAGTVRLAGAPRPAAWSPRRAAEAGLVLLAEDRQRHGLFLEAANAVNLSSLMVHRLPLLLRPRREASRFEEYRRSLGIRCTGPWQAVGRLSGGNQQKVLLAKCLAVGPRVLILDEPTRGVDAAARQDIYGLIERLAASGTAVLLISSDFDEIVRLSHRIAVMAGGRLAGELPAGASPESIAALAFGAATAGRGVAAHV